jgi:predicted ATPase
MGMHTGTPTVTAEGYVGEDVHLGARIAAAGHGGQVLMSGATLASGAPSAVVDLGEHRLKDFSAPVWIHQLGDERFPPLKTISNTNLPRPASSFVGREREVAEIAAMLRNGARLLTLTGPGGTGKTRLSVEAANELIGDFKSGVFWVPLAAVRDPGLVPVAIAHTLGAKGELAEHIGEREMLLVVDNLEQVVKAAPALATLVESCPNLRLLTTSREVLRVRGEVEYPVPPLDGSDAVELFSARSGVTSADPAIAELCRRLDNLPLAVELAAARTSVLTPAQILERLSKRLDVLKGGRDADARQQTLRATIEWSHDLLTDDERRLFANLAVFRGGSTLQAAEEIAGADIDVLQSLVDKSLVRRTGERFWMLETIREFAVERLSELPDAAVVRRRHADHFLELAERLEPLLLSGPSATPAFDTLAAEHENVRAALDHYESVDEFQSALALAGAVQEFWDQRGHHVEALKRFVRLLEADRSPTEARARALDGASMIGTKRDNLGTAAEWAQEAFELHRRFGNEHGMATSLWGLGYIRLEEGREDDALRLLEEAADMMTRSGDMGSLAWLNRTRAFTHYRRGEVDQARVLYESNLQRARAVGDSQLEAATLGGLSSIAVDEGRLSDAIAIEQQSLAIVDVLADELMANSRLANSARVLAAAGRMHSAAALVGYVEMRYAEMGTEEPWVARLNETTLAHARARLDEDQVEKSLAEGRTLKRDTATQLASSEMAAAARDMRT